MFFDVAPLDFQTVLQLPTCSLECIANCDIDVLVCGLVIGHAAHSYLIALCPDVDYDVVEPSLALMLVRRFHSNAAADDVVAKQFEFLRVFANGRLDGRGWPEAVKINLYWNLHISQTP